MKNTVDHLQWEDAFQAKAISFPPLSTYLAQFVPGYLRKENIKH